MTACLSFDTVFYDIIVRACTDFKTDLRLLLLLFFCLSFFSFSSLLALVFDLLLGSLTV